MEDKLIYVVLLEGSLVGVFDNDSDLKKFTNKKGIKKLGVDVEEILINQPYEPPYKLG
jgi:hypothetical protein